MVPHTASAYSDLHVMNNENHLGRQLGVKVNLHFYSPIALITALDSPLPGAILLKPSHC